MTALHYACQRSNDITSISTILSYHKDNINAVSKDGLTALDLLTRRDVIGGGLSQHQQCDMVKLIKNNGGKSGGVLLHLNPESRILITAEDCDVASLPSLSPEVISDPTFQASPSSSSLGSGSRSASLSAASDQSRDSSSASGAANSGASYEEALASQVLTEFP